MSNDAEVRARTIAGEAVNGLQMDKLQREARQRMMKDMCGGFYDEHLARTLADHLADSIALAFAAEARSHDGEWVLVRREALLDAARTYCLSRELLAVLDGHDPVSAVPLFDEGRL